MATMQVEQVVLVRMVAWWWQEQALAETSRS